MKKIKKSLAFIQQLVRRPHLGNLILNDESVWKSKHLKKHPQFTSLPQILLETLDEQPIYELDSFLLEGTTLPMDIVLLKTLAKKHPAYFEIGSWRGESIWNVSQITKDCTSLNLSKQSIFELTKDHKYAEQHGILSKLNKNILQISGNSKDFDFKTLNRKFDLIFIDGDHTYEMVKQDTEKVFEHLVHEKSLVVWHDFASSPEKIRYEVFMGILDGLPTEKHTNIYHVSNTLCAIYHPETLINQGFKSYNHPKYLYKINIAPKPFE